TSGRSSRSFSTITRWRAGQSPLSCQRLRVTRVISGAGSPARAAGSGTVAQAASMKTEASASRRMRDGKAMACMWAPVVAWRRGGAIVAHGLPTPGRWVATPRDACLYERLQPRAFASAPPPAFAGEGARKLAAEAAPTRAKNGASAFPWHRRRAQYRIQVVALVPRRMQAVEEVQPRARAFGELRVVAQLLFEASLQCRILGQHFAGDFFGHVRLHVLLALEGVVE